VTRLPPPTVLPEESRVMFQVVSTLCQGHCRGSVSILQTSFQQRHKKDGRTVEQSILHTITTTIISISIVYIWFMSICILNQHQNAMASGFFYMPSTKSCRAIGRASLGCYANQRPVKGLLFAETRCGSNFNLISLITEYDPEK
jgi:hypothetical protein